jgi:hypothetical protein
MAGSLRPGANTNKMMTDYDNVYSMMNRKGGMSPKHDLLLETVFIELEYRSSDFGIINSKN